MTRLCPVHHNGTGLMYFYCLLFLFYSVILSVGEESPPCARSGTGAYEGDASLPLRITECRNKGLLFYAHVVQYIPCVVDAQVYSVAVQADRIIVIIIIVCVRTFCTVCFQFLANGVEVVATDVVGV